MNTTRRVFMLFTAALAVSAATPCVAMRSEASFWSAFSAFSDQCLSTTPTPDSLSLTAAELGWVPLSPSETRALAAPMGVVPGVHLAWRVPGEDYVVEVGGSGMWSMARVMHARERGEQIDGPLPDVVEPGADTQIFGLAMCISLVATRTP